jgi:hypothetical protein
MFSMRIQLQIALYVIKFRLSNINTLRTGDANLRF